jgi:hypothetical protein
MIKTSEPLDQPDPRAQLVTEHAGLEHMFDELVSALDAGANSDIDQCWTELEGGLSRHMALEERCLFEPLSEAHPGEVAELRADHVRLRALLRELGVGIDLHQVSSQTLEQFTVALESHARKEEDLARHLTGAGVDPRDRDRSAVSSGG